MQKIKSSGLFAGLYTLLCWFKSKNPDDVTIIHYYIECIFVSKSNIFLLLLYNNTHKII